MVLPSLQRISTSFLLVVISTQQEHVCIMLLKSAEYLQIQIMLSACFQHFILVIKCFLVQLNTFYFIFLRQSLMNLTSTRTRHRIPHRLWAPLAELMYICLFSGRWWSCSSDSCNVEYLWTPKGKLYLEEGAASWGNSDFQIVFWWQSLSKCTKCSKSKTPILS